MLRNILIFNQVLLILILIPLSFILSCRSSTEDASADPLSTLLHSSDLKLVDEVPLRFETHHVQGLDLTEQFYFVTAVDKEQKQGWLFKVQRKNASLHSKMELTNGTLIHPGGIQFDGRYLWIPNAEYRRKSWTMIYGVDPNSLEICRSFSVDDHIGAIASDGKNHLYGVDWYALHFYTWDPNGRLLSKVDSPTIMAYQDIKYFEGKLLCSGQKGGDSAIDIIDPENWILVKRINLPRFDRKNTLSREGMTFNGNLYFLPDDGPDSHIMIFTLN